MAVKTYYDPWFDNEFTYEDIELVSHGKKLFFQKVTGQNADPKRHLILAHGLTATHNAMDIQVKGYSLTRNFANDGITCYLMDMSGHGLSEEWEDPLSITTKTAAEDIIAGAEKIKEMYGVETVDAIGYSWGTMTVSLAAVMRPDLFRKIILQAPTTKGNKGFLPTLPKDTFKDMPYAGVSYEGFARLFPIKGVKGGYEPPIDFEFDTKRVELEVVDKATHDFFRYVFSRKRPNGPAQEILTQPPYDYIQWQNIKCPTFVGYGTDDIYTDEDVLLEDMKCLPEGSGCFRCEGGTHGFAWQKGSARVLAAYIDFLRA